MIEALYEYSEGRGGDSALGQNQEWPHNDKNKALLCYI